GPEPASVHVRKSPPDHGSGAEPLVPAVRPEPAHLRAQHLPAAREELPSPGASGVPHGAVSVEHGDRRACQSLTIPPQPSAGWERLTVIRSLAMPSTIRAPEDGYGPYSDRVCPQNRQAAHP